MKNLLLTLLIIAAVFVSQAQNKNPTKEETISYIKNALNQSMKPREDDNGTYKFWQYTDSVKFSGCLLTLFTRSQYERFTDSKDHGTNFRQFKIDLSTIESIELHDSFIVFTSKNLEKLISSESTYSDEREIRKALIVDAKCPYTSESEKIIKAFNHLRKLCGAPEPIKFD